MIHEIKINGYKPTPTKIPLGTAESFGNEVLHLVGDEMWDGLLVSATFHNDVAVVVYAEDGYIKVPAEATAKPTKNGIIVITGIGADNRVYTVNLGYIVHDHAEATGTDPVEPTPGQVEQLERIALFASESASSAAVSAEQARRASEDVAPAVTDYLAQFHEQFKGDPGKDGKDGRDGIDGKDGRDGRDGVDGINGRDGRDGVDGKDGKDGEKGDKGDPGEGMEIPTIRYSENEDGDVTLYDELGATIINLFNIDESVDAEEWLFYLSSHFTEVHDDGTKDEFYEYSYYDAYSAFMLVANIFSDGSTDIGFIRNQFMQEADWQYERIFREVKQRFDKWDGGAY